MSRHLPLILTGLICLSVLTLHSALYLSPTQQGKSIPAINRKLSHLSIMPADKPDFAAIKPVKARKQAFFEFMDKYITQGNRRIQRLRARIESNDLTIKELLATGEEYRIKTQDLDSIREQLLIKVDIVPPALVKAQAAMESAWGTSRFAVQGNNYFGQWCLSEGCGMVPQDRHHERNHEVQVFDSPQESVDSYLRNLNSHRAYRKLRRARAELRQQNQDINGCYLASGLTSYSEQGQRYVESLKKLIRVNRLESEVSEFCAPVLIADDRPGKTSSNQASSEQEEARRNQEQERNIAVDETQSRANPKTKRNPPSS